ncbi:MAG: hypothetical protein OEZ01_06040 [Candidatus Heimdallarchaeota archaeon]|nr:hypothetical protein [Candidatus Heimdallarchaeota archaeon]MDH5645547.1 hypothetical protein [Candidatus Heimdallarchaeota archaeon]
MTEEKIMNQLRELLDSGDKWARLETDVPGLHIVRMPRLKNRPARLSVEVNPSIPSVGKPQKKSLFITTEEQFIEYNRVFSSETIKNVISYIEKINNEDNIEGDRRNIVGKLGED